MTASDRAQWIVVACTDCREHWLLENSERTVTAECPRCGRTHLRRKLQPLATAATDQEAADKRAELLMQTARSTGGATDEPVAMESFASARDRVEALSLAEQSAETARATGDAPTLDIPKVGHEEWNEAVWADLAAQGGLLEPTRAEQVQEALVEDGPFAFNTVATDIDEDTTLPDPDWPRDEGSLTPIFPGDDTALNDIELKIGPKMSQWGPTLVEKLLEPAADALRDRLRRDDELPSRRDVSAVATWLVRVAGVSAFDETWAHQFAEFALDRPDESQYDDMADAEEVRTRAAVEAQQRARRETLTQVAVPGGTPSGSVEQVVRGPIAALTILDDLLDISIRFDAAAWAAADTRTGQRSIDLLHALARTSTVKIVVSSRGLAEQLAAYDITADLTEPFEATPPTQAEATQSRSQQEKARDRLDAIDNWQNGYGRVLLALPDDRAMRQQELLETVVNLSSSGVSRALSTLERASLVRKESDANYNVVSLTSLGEVARAHIDSKDGSLRDPPPVDLRCGLYWTTYPHQGLRLRRTMAQTYRVLHVDDEVEFLDLIEAYMYSVAPDIVYETTNDPHEALARVKSDDDSIEALVTDFDMPEMNGLELLQAVRELDERLPVLLYTGLGSEEVAAEAISTGVTDYIQKDHGKSHVQVLSNTLRNAIDRAEAEELAELRLAALEAVREGIAVFSPDGELVYANPAHQRLYGYTLEEAVGTSWTDFHPDSDVNTIRAEVLPAVELSGEWHGSGTGLRADDTEFPESKSISEMPNGGFAVVVIDADQESDASV